MVPGQHPVVDAEDDVRHAEVFVVRRRQAFEDSSPVVREVAGGASLEWREPRQRSRRKRRQQPPEDVEGIAACGWRAVTLHMRRRCCARSRRDRRRRTSSGRGADSVRRCRETTGTAGRGAVRSTPPDPAPERVPSTRGREDAIAGRCVQGFLVVERGPPARLDFAVSRTCFGFPVSRRRQVAPRQRLILPVGLAKRDGEGRLGQLLSRGRTRAPPRPRRAARRGRRAARCPCCGRIVRCSAP